MEYAKTNYVFVSCASAYISAHQSIELLKNTTVGHSAYIQAYTHTDYIYTECAKNTWRFLKFENHRPCHSVLPY
jgi:hypothetical protein